jgi:hypothetical protein
MSGISLDELRQRHATVLAERERHRKAYMDKEIAYAYVLGEYETLMELITKRDAEAAAAELAQLEADAGIVPAEGAEAVE